MQVQTFRRFKFSKFVVIFIYIGNLFKKYSQLSSCYKLKRIRFTLMTNKYIYNGLQQHYIQ